MAGCENMPRFSTVQRIRGILLHWIDVPVIVRDGFLLLSGFSLNQSVT